MASVKVRPLPPGKSDGAFDAGKAYLVDHHGQRHQGMPPRERIKLDEDGMPAIDEDSGTPVTTWLRKPPGEWWVSRSGSVVWIRTSSGSAVDPRADEVRRSQARSRMHRYQAIRFSACPVSDAMSRMWIPKTMRKEKPCDRGDFVDGCCKHVKSIVKKRTDAHNKRERLRARATVTAATQQLEATQQQTKVVTKLLGHLSNRTAEVIGGD